MSIWFKIGLVIAALYCAVLLTLFLAQRSLIYPAPTEAVPPPPGFEQVSYQTSDGLLLNAAWHSAGTFRPTIIFFHGNGDNWSGGALATQAFVDSGYNVLLPEYRGYSGNPGSPDEQGLYRDGRAALAWLSAQGTSAEELVVVGNSLGSGVAIQLATETSPKALILVSPFSSMAGLINEKFPWVPVRLLLRDHYANVEKLPRIEAPILLLHGSQDSLIPIAHARKLKLAGKRTELKAFENVGHELAYLPEGQAEQIRWLDRLMEN